MYRSVLALLLALAIASTAQKFQFQVGQEFSYALSSSLSPVASSTPSTTEGLLTGLVEAQCTQILDNGDFIFVMNIFNVEVGANDVVVRKALDDTPLGYDVYFQYTASGQIPNIWYDGDDPQYYVNVKVGAINAFQTYLIQAGQKQVVKEVDVVGTHTSNYQAMKQDNTLIVGRVFTETDIIAFADTSVSPSSVQFASTSSVTVHADGYPISMSVGTRVLFMSASGQRVRSSSTSGFDSSLGAIGSLTLSLTDTKVVHLEASATIPVSYTKTSLPELSVLGQIAPKSQFISNSDELVQFLLLPSSSGNRELVRYFTDHPENTLPYFMSALSILEDPVSFMNAYYVLAALDTEDADYLLVLHGLQADEEWKQFSSFATVGAGSSSSSIMLDSVSAFVQSYTYKVRDAITNKAQIPTPSVAERGAILAFGSLLRRADLPPSGLSLLQNLLALAQEAGDEDLVTLVTSAIVNTGLAVNVPLGRFDASLFPRNFSWSQDLTFGGSQVGADFRGGAFIGSNLDCKHPTFNYGVNATATADITLFGTTMQAFQSWAIYLREGDTTLTNSLYLQVFDDVIYNQPIPVPNQDCQTGVFPVANFLAPGVDINYWVWVGPIPVNFDASVDLSFSMDWGYSICEDDLTAIVSATPNAKLIASGSTLAYLLVVEATLQLDADFDVSVVPQASVSGTSCSFGIEATATLDPMEASIIGEWREMSCSWWGWDCEWGPWTIDNLWSWSAAADQYVLFNKAWPIA